MPAGPVEAVEAAIDLGHVRAGEGVVRGQDRPRIGSGGGAHPDPVGRLVGAPPQAGPHRVGIGLPRPPGVGSGDPARVDLAVPTMADVRGIASSRAGALVAAMLLVAVPALVGGCVAAEGEASSDASTTAADGTGPFDGPSPGEPGAPDLPQGRDVVVTSITDGDTFRSGEERVRLTGIDTPEVNGPVECYGPEATDALTALIPPGAQVRLVGDVEAEDRYDRTLAYVYRLEDATFVNLRLAREGFATPLSIAPNVAHEDEVAAAAQEARAEGRGLWSRCPLDEDDRGVAPSTTTGSGPTAPAGGGDCDPSYPGVCIPPSPPDLDCSDISARDFTVLPPDPHRFDGGGDGRGCERR